MNILHLLALFCFALAFFVGIEIVREILLRRREARRQRTREYAKMVHTYWSRVK